MTKKKKRNLKNLDVAHVWKNHDHMMNLDKTVLPLFLFLIVSMCFTLCRWLMFCLWKEVIHPGFHREQCYLLKTTEWIDFAIVPSTYRSVGLSYFGFVWKDRTLLVLLFFAEFLFRFDPLPISTRELIVDALWNLIEDIPPTTVYILRHILCGHHTFRVLTADPCFFFSAFLVCRISSFDYFEVFTSLYFIKIGLIVWEDQFF